MPIDAAFLEGVELFRALDAEERSNLAGSMELREAAKGDILFHQGDAGDSLFVVKSGMVELFVKDHAGQEISLHHVGPRDAFGELSLLDGRPRTATARVAEDATMMVLGRAELLALVRKTPDLALDILSHMSQETRRADELLRSRVSRNVNVVDEEKLTPFERIADWIAVFSGSMLFLIMNTLWFGIWILANTVGLPGISKFDPFPFGLLTMIVSLEAIFLSIFVLISQARQAAKDRVRSDIEYEVNVKAEMEVAHLHEKLDRIADQVAERLSRLERQGK